MTVYYFCLFFLFIFAMLEVAGAKNIKVIGKTSINSIAFIYIAMFLSILTSMRFQVGRDWTNYLHMYNNIESMIKHVNLSFEFGYALLNYVFSFLPHGFYWMQFCTMTFCTVSIYTSFYKRSEYPVFALCLYFCMYFFSTELAQTRQHIAMAILILGGRFIERKKLICWILIIVLAMQFHITSIIAFPLYFTSRIRKLSPFLGFLVLFFAFFLNLFGLNLVWKMMGIVLTMPFVPKRIVAILNMYMHSDVYGKQGEYSTGLGFLLNYFFAFLVIFFYALDMYGEKTVQKATGEYDVQRRTILQRRSAQISNLLVAFLFQSMGRNFDQFGRLANYYFICGGGFFAYNYLASMRFFSKKYLKFLSIFLCALLVLSKIYNTVRWFEHLEYTYRFLPFNLNQL